VEST